MALWGWNGDTVVGTAWFQSVLEWMKLGVVKKKQEQMAGDISISNVEKEKNHDPKEYRKHSRMFLSFWENYSLRRCRSPNDLRSIWGSLRTMHVLNETWDGSLQESSFMWGAGLPTTVWSNMVLFPWAVSSFGNWKWTQMAQHSFVVGLDAPWQEHKDQILYRALALEYEWQPLPWTDCIDKIVSLWKGA